MPLFGKRDTSKTPDKKSAAEQALKAYQHNISQTSSSQTNIAELTDADALGWSKSANLGAKVYVVWRDQTGIQNKGFDDGNTALEFFESNRKYRKILKYDETKKIYIVTDEYQLKRGLRQQPGETAQPSKENQVKLPAEDLEYVVNADKEAQNIAVGAIAVNRTEDELVAILREASYVRFGIKFHDLAGDGNLTNFKYDGCNIYVWHFFKEAASARDYYNKITDLTSNLKSHFLLKVEVAVLSKKNGAEAQLSIAPTYNFLHNADKHGLKGGKG